MRSGSLHGGALSIAFLVLMGGNIVVASSLLDDSFPLNPGAEGHVNVLLRLPDDRIVVGGTFTRLGATAVTNVAVLAPDGNLDASFELRANRSVHKLEESADGKLWMSGEFTHVNGVNRPGLARLIEALQLDTSFVPESEFLANENSFACYSFGEQNGGKIVASYFAFNRGHVTRFNSDGSEDLSFNSTNVFHDAIHATSVLPDGRILVGGRFQFVNDFPRPGMALLSQDGDLVESIDFGLASGGTVMSFLVDSESRVLVAGRLFSASAPDEPILLARLGGDLNWDVTWPGIGWHRHMTYYFAHTSTALERPGGGWFVGGDFLEVDGYFRRGIVSLNSDGTVDSHFDPGLGFGSSPPFSPIRSMVMDAQGRLVVGGVFDWVDHQFDQEGIARLNLSNDGDDSRVHLVNPGSGYQVFGISRAPGVIHLDYSTNLVDWWTFDYADAPFVQRVLGNIDTPSSAFIRARKEPELNLLTPE